MCIPAVRVSGRVRSYRSLEPAVMMTPTVAETRSGSACEAREIRASAVGERVLYGQRVDGRRALSAGGAVALVSARARAEDDRCRFVAGVWREDVGENDRTTGARWLGE